MKGESRGVWDSHICFAAGSPLRLEDEVRVYYMGGDGPHYSPAWPSPLHRNSSFGLATLRQDGFIGIKATSSSNGGAARTTAITVSGNGQLIATADTAGAFLAAPGNDASVVISVGGKQCGTIAGKNVTDFKLPNCNSLSVGTNITLDIQLKGNAVLYTVGFV